MLRASYERQYAKLRNFCVLSGGWVDDYFKSQSP
jgi:hypothetical protein